MKAVLVTFTLALFVSAIPADETGTIFGIVTDRDTGMPIPYANVVVVDTKMGGMTLTDGTYRIIGVPVGTYTIKAMMMGYRTVEKSHINVNRRQKVEVNFALEWTIVGTTQEIVVEAELPQTKVAESDIIQRPRTDRRERLPVDDVVEAVALKRDIIKTGDELHVRGGRSGEVWYQISDAPVDDPLGSGTAKRHDGEISKRCTPSRGCRPGTPCRPRIPRRAPCEEWNTEEYGRIVENDFLEGISNPLSTFSIDVDIASYGNMRRFIMNDQMPPRDAIRIEELINYFDYEYKQPAGDAPFAINIEYSECPWNREHRLVHIGLEGEKLAEEDRKQSNLVFLIDVSGSMRPHNKLPLLRKAFTLLVDQLRDDDRVSIVVYAGAAGLVLPSTSGSKRETIKDVIGRLEAGGSTAGGAGIKLAYEIAKENCIKGGNNRVILATDGDFNVGVSSTSDMVRLIEERRKNGIFLTVLGFGMGNYKDQRLEQIADKGNGNHAYIDNILEAKKVFVDDLTGTLYTIAKDVKIQVEFNPAKVGSYRLIGYENRLLKKEYFDDDTKDAGEIGAGHTVTVLYEIVPADDAPGGYDLKYQEMKIKNEAERTDEVLTVGIRYKEPDGDTSKLITTVLDGNPVPLKRSSENMRFSAAVAMFGMILRESQYRGNATIDDVIELVRKSRGDDPFGYRAEFLQIVERAKLLNDLASR